ncbi:hypothetical protein [uncultured Tateyamaria sp.]|uniref:hypothetical protein n=1 Tax=uncultured Tateyamaria sp. TaxID=455651 RepID=UPI002609112E|nr:hypothetical protein [uncultured Tateyamaria sp.]
MRCALALALAVWAGPLAAQDGVACLQNQLAALGHYPGPADGTMRPSVRAAAAQVDQVPGLPDLRRRTATSWCREIGRTNPDMRAFWPSEQDPLILTEAPADADLLRATLDRVRAYFRDSHDIELATAVAVIGSADPATFDPAIARVNAAQQRPGRAKPVDTTRFCPERGVGGAANRAYVMFCWSDTIAQGGWSPEDTARLAKVMAHEYTHQVQYALAADDPAQKVDGAWALGPHWMVEGVAELVEWQFDSDRILADGPALFDLQTAARRSRLTLDQLSAHGTVRDSEAYGVARFAAYLLAQRHGMAALFDYFRALGRGMDQAQAFQATFDQSPAAYAALFETLRRDYGAARRFGREDR